MSRADQLVATFSYTEGSTSYYLYTSLDSTVGSLRKAVQMGTRVKIEEQWPRQPNIWVPSTHASLASIIITTDRHGSNAFTDDSQKLRDLCSPGDKIYAVVPSPQTAMCDPRFAAFVPGSLSSPIRRCMEDQKNSLDGKLLEATEARQRVELEMEREKAHEEERGLKLLKVFEARLAEERTKEREQEAEARRIEREREAEARRIEREQEAEARRIEKEETDKRFEQLSQEANRKIEEVRQEANRKAEQADKKAEQTRQDADSKTERLRNHLLEVKDTGLNTAGWLAGNDTKMLDRIKLRHLLDKAQEKLALTVGLANNRFRPSWAWREALGPSDVLSARLGKARSLLYDPKIQLDTSTKNLLLSTEGMALVADVSSLIRDRGDKIAHPAAVPHTQLDGSISRSNLSMTTDSGWQALADFVYGHS